MVTNTPPDIRKSTSSFGLSVPSTAFTHSKAQPHTQCSFFLLGFGARGTVEKAALRYSYVLLTSLPRDLRWLCALLGAVMPKSILAP